MTYKRYAAALLVALPLLTSCYSDDKLSPPKVTVIDPMFERYVSLGNSLTAGFQSAGLNDSLQQRAYPVLLAAAMQTPFAYPQLSGFGCPPPLSNNVIPTFVGGPGAPQCGLRTMVLGPMNNFAFPGAVVKELYDNFGDFPSQFDVYKTFLVGGRTQLELMQQRHPTFVSVWIGANDAVGSLISANPGNSAEVTDTAAWRVSYDSVLDVIQAEGANAVLISLPSNLSGVPYASSGAIWYCAKNGGCPSPPFPPQNPLLAGIPTFTVNANCAPIPPAGGGIPVLVPWTVAFQKVKAALGGTPSSIDCSVDNEVVTAAEAAKIVTFTNAYNAHIAAEATARNFAYFDINPLMNALVTNGTIPRFPIVWVSAPPVVDSITFGPMYSLDGFHISSTAQRLVADSVASAINQHYGTSLPVPVCGTVSCPAP